MRESMKRAPEVRSVIRQANDLKASDRLRVVANAPGQLWRRSSHLATRASLLTLIGQTAQVQAVPAFSGVEISANPASVQSSQDRIDLVIAIAKNASFDEIQLFLPKAKQILRNGQQFALIDTYPTQEQARSTGLALQDSLPWPLELLIYKTAGSATDVSAAGQTPVAPTDAAAAPRPEAKPASFQAPAAVQPDPRQLLASRGLAFNSGSDAVPNRPQTPATARRNQAKASDLGGELSASAMGLVEPSLLQPAGSSPEPAPNASADTMSAVASASTPASLETGVATSVIVPPILSEQRQMVASKPTQQPLDPAPSVGNPTQTQSAGVSAAMESSRSQASPTVKIGGGTPDAQLSSSSPSTDASFIAIRPDLDYLGVIIRSDQDLEALRQFATVSEIGSLGGQTIARVGVYARSRVGQNLLRLRLLQIRQAGLTPEVISNLGNTPASAA